MTKLLLALLIMALGVCSTCAMGDESHEPTSADVQEGKVVYASVPSAVDVINEVKIQHDDQNSTGHGQAK